MSSSVGCSELVITTTVCLPQVTTTVTVDETCTVTHSLSSLGSSVVPTEIPALSTPIENPATIGNTITNTDVVVVTHTPSAPQLSPSSPVDVSKTSVSTPHTSVPTHVPTPVLLSNASTPAQTTPAQFTGAAPAKDISVRRVLFAGLVGSVVLGLMGL